jgi:hypothetical protein
MWAVIRVWISEGGTRFKPESGKAPTLDSSAAATIRLALGVVFMW